MRYIKQLDSVRAISVGLVIISHWFSSIPFIINSSLGLIGVNTFFVLSGFLITHILISNRHDADKSSLSYSSLLINFYSRRALRIFPIYYLTIFLAFIFSTESNTRVNDAIWYYATYTANIYYFKTQQWDGMLSPVWSLSVEEQFYLFWPGVVLFVKKTNLLAIIILFTLTGALSHYFMLNNEWVGVLTFTCFDCFGMGALLAYIVAVEPQYLDKFRKWLNVIASAGLVYLILHDICHVGKSIPVRPVTGIIALWVITYIYCNSESKKMKFDFILNNTILIFLGKISYGLYLYHSIIFHIVSSRYVRSTINSRLPDFIKSHNWLLILAESTILLLIVSYLSFILIEKPFLHLKKRFEYHPASVPA